MKTLKQRSLSSHQHKPCVYYEERLGQFLRGEVGLSFKKKFKKEARDILKAEKETWRTFKKNHDAGLFFKKQKEILKQWVDCIKKIEKDFGISNILELNNHSLQLLKKKRKST